MPGVVRRSSAGHIHMSRCCRRFEVKIMRARFAAKCLVNGNIHRTGIVPTQRRAQVDMVIMSKAHIKLSRGRNPDAVAAFTKIAGQW